MLKSVVVPLDGTPLAERAPPFAARLQRSSGARLTLIRALPALNRMFVTNASGLRIAQARQNVADEQARQDTLHVAERLRKDNLSVDARMQAGDPPRVILEEAKGAAADLIVMFTHGRAAGQRFLFGSVIDQVLVASEIPILVISPNCDENWPSDQVVRRILVALDGSRHAEDVLPGALELAETLGAELVLLRCVESDSADDVEEAKRYLDRCRAALSTPADRTRVRCEVGSAVQTVKRIAEAEEVDVIAMATHGRSGLARLVAGSVSTAVVRDAPVPVLVVRPTALGRIVLTRACLKRTSRFPLPGRGLVRTRFQRTSNDNAWSSREEEECKHNRRTQPRT
jgi:nucleotide-binding universal stress UspA family protein